jgi:hypothetical protein
MRVWNYKTAPIEDASKHARHFLLRTNEYIVTECLSLDDRT